VNLSKIKVALLFGGQSAEHEVSIMSATSVFQAADKSKYQVIPIGISKDGYWVPPAKSLEVITEGYSTVDQVLEQNDKSILESLQFFLEADFDLVFPLLHGPFGEDGKIQGFFETTGLPYVGAGVLSSAICMDKAIIKKIFSYHDLPQADFIIIKKNHFNEKSLAGIRDLIDRKISFPCFVKPANMGSSIGISKVLQPEELEKACRQAFKYDEKLIVEENICGREIECSVLGGNNLKASLPGEIIPADEFYDYRSKYQDESTKLVIPAPLTQEEISAVQRLAIKAFEVIDGFSLCRVDFFLREEDGCLLINEINTLPGFTRYSMYPKLWEASGVSYSDLIDNLIKIALEN